ncbi:MAG: ATP-binding protein [Planctomycetes bacterium]|nr:ATP-binding protein [Planctomycetota bacterium]MCW8136597.1 ATP-binding protein [Planctomycetota bacterium]
MPELFIGFDRLAQPGPAPVHLKSHTLLRHVMALGSSGSGKTVFCKAVTEEVLRAGVPAICIDPQGDLCSLALHLDDPAWLANKGVDPEFARLLQREIDPVIFTPASRKGIAISADPVSADLDDLEARDRVYAITGIATMIVSLLGYDLDSDDGAGLVAAFDKALTGLAGREKFPRDLGEFTQWLARLDDAGKKELASLVDPRKLDQAAQKLARLDVGARRLLFHEGLSLDIDLLLGNGDRSANEGRTRLSVIYLNSLHTQEDKEFFVAALTERLYSWMLRNPSSEPQALFYIDEVAPFIPPVRKPACKPALSLLFKQARKYGVCCLMATQNPADVDYKAMAQFGTWALGRMTTRQDMAKVQPTVKSLDPVHVDAVMQELPALKPGQFLLISPDNFDRTVRLQTRWLLTKHETLDEDKIEHTVDSLRLYVEPPADGGEAPEPPTMRERFDALEAELKQQAQQMPDADEDNADDAEVSDDAAQEPESTPTKAAQPKPDKPVSVLVASPPPDPEVEESDKVLCKAASMAAKDFATRTGLGEGAARARLRRLVSAGRAREYKDGRVVRYYSVAGGMRPDLGLERKVSALICKVSGNDVERKARELRGRSSFFGLLGEDEDLQSFDIEYRLVLQLGFTEKVTRAFFKRLFGSSHDEMVDYIYLHPYSLRIVVYDPGKGISLHDKPGDYASRIIDFDGMTQLEEIEPARLKLRESDLKTRKSDDVVKQSFKQRFNASPKSVKPVFLPVWNLHFGSRGRSAERMVCIDALTGNPLEW